MKVSLLLDLFGKTPSMQCVDGVKLLYQHHFGCGHLLAAPEKVAARVAEELSATEPSADVSPAEFIGGGLCRLNLRNADVRRLSPEIIARMMLLTQEHHGNASQNSQEAFLGSLATLTDLARQGKTPFSADDLADYLRLYAADGYPMVSHSKEYRRLYQPAYRVVLSDFATLLPVVLALEERRSVGPALAVLDGPCGSGKSTLAGLLSRLYDAPVIPMDDFFLPPELRTPQRFAEPGGNIHHERFLAEVMGPLVSGEAFTYQRFDCSTFGLSPKKVEAAPVRIVEGSYSLHPVFREGWKGANAVTAYVSVDEDAQLERIAARNPEMLEMFKTRWIPLEKKYAEAYHSICWADFRLTSISWEADA